VARLLLRGEYYDSVSPHALREDDYEKLLLANGADLYPSWNLVAFKQVVESEYGRAKADLALIDRRYRRWWVVEVELGSHPFSTHVEPQVRRLANGAYGPSHADSIHSAMPTLDRRAVGEMIMGEQPRVLVLVNQPKPDWLPALHIWGARVGIVEVFRSPRNVDVLRINGEHPDDLGDLVSLCRVDPLIPSSLIVASPAALGVSSGEKLTLVFEGGLTEWRRVDVADRVWLMPIRRSPLPTNVSGYRITEDGTGRLMITPIRKP
jgi:hypothetical protein